MFRIQEHVALVATRMEEVMVWPSCMLLQLPGCANRPLFCRFQCAEAHLLGLYGAALVATALALVVCGGVTMN